jgi:hypothetical protein
MLYILHPGVLSNLALDGVKRQNAGGAWQVGKVSLNGDTNLLIGILRTMFEGEICRNGVVDGNCISGICDDEEWGCWVGYLQGDHYSRNFTYLV